MKKLTQDQVIQKFIKIHGNKYDYSKVIYLGTHIKVCIICPIHGEFWQTPHNHLAGQGCVKCGYSKNSLSFKHTTEQFIQKSNQIHNNKYKYPNAVYESAFKKLSVTCEVHGDFLQTPNNHLNGQGCPLCYKETVGKWNCLSTEEFIKRAIEIHGYFYDYSKVNYVNSQIKVCIICPVHGEFCQTPNDHMYGHGCLKCNESKGEKIIKEQLEKYPEKWLRQFDVIATDEAHTAQAVTIERILMSTFGSATYRFGLSGTYPNVDTCEYLSICSLMGPTLLKVGTRELIDKKLISDLKIKALILNHNDQGFADSICTIKKGGNGAKAYNLEKEYAQASIQRRDFITKLTNRFDQNSLLLFHNIEYGTLMYEYLSNNVINKDFYYIDGSTSTEKRSYILKQLNDTTGNTKILVASFGTLSTGVNVKAICNIVFMDSFKSDKIVRQSIGRGLRLHVDKVKLHVFDIVDVFHKSFKNALYNHYLVRKNDIYIKQDLPFDEIKITL